MTGAAADESESEATRQEPKGPPWRTALELVAALALALGGAAYLFQKDLKPESWIGFGFIGLAVFILLMRGQAIRGVKVGPGGIVIDLEEVAADAKQAKQEAAAAKQIALQQVVPAGKSGTGISSALFIEAPRQSAEESDRWDHPGLKRKPAPDNDPQKNQWGGQDTRNGRRVSAKVLDTGEDLFEIALLVEPVGSAPPIEGTVRFHLHDTFPRPVRSVRPSGGRARLTLIAWGAFTVGVEVEGEPKTFLELDLADPRYGFPKRFRNR